jgi:glycosyltransferase involved in cell wall biosynthesis
MQENLSIIIPTMDRDKIFQKTLKAAYDAIQNFNAEIIVVNDSKSSVPFIPDFFSDKVILINNNKSGVASARNAGAKNSKFEVLLFLDDDIIINGKNIEASFKILRDNANSALNLNWTYPPELNSAIAKTQFGRFLISNGFTSLKGWHNNSGWDENKLFEIDLIASYFLFITKKDFSISGGYNENFPHAGAEDYDFAKRLSSKNIKNLCYPLNTVFHNEEDRVDLLPWLTRKERAAETRRIGVKLGHTELEIKAGNSKIKLSRLLFSFKGLIFLSLKLIPNLKAFDSLYSKIVNKLLALYLYKGYFKHQ